MTIQREPTTPTADDDGTAPLAAALAAFQADMPTVAKSKTANTGTYSYRYADLADVTSAALPLLTKHGLSFSAVPRWTDHGLELVGVLLHSSGESMEGALPIGGNTPQALGSSITYARRYLFGCMTGVVTDDDDDGQAASTTKAPRKRAAAAPVEAEEADGRISTKQTRLMGALMRELGLTDRAEALDYVAGVIGHPIDSRKDLTVHEAGQVIDALQTRGAPVPERRTVEGPPTPVDPWDTRTVPPARQGSTGPPGPADPDADYLETMAREAERDARTRVDLEDVPLPFGDDVPRGSDTNPEPAPEPAPVAPPPAARVPASTARRIDRLLRRELGDIATEEEKRALASAILDSPVLDLGALTRPQVLKLAETFDRFKDGSLRWEFDLTDTAPVPRVLIHDRPGQTQG